MIVGSQAVYTSSQVQSHHHTFGVDLTAFASPPSAGVSGTTSLAVEHLHTVSISAAALSSVQNGETVKITTSSSAGHTHVFTFVKIA